MHQLTYFFEMLNLHIGIIIVFQLKITPNVSKNNRIALVVVLSVASMHFAWLNGDPGFL